jgi:2-aminoethylphosphonate transport system substrate-binding protein
MTKTNSLQATAGLARKLLPALVAAAAFGGMAVQAHAADAVVLYTADRHGRQR